MKYAGLGRVRKGIMIQKDVFSCEGGILEGDVEELNEVKRHDSTNGGYCWLTQQVQGFASYCID